MPPKTEVTLDFISMLSSMKASIGSVMTLITGAALLIGIIFIIKGLMMLRMQLQNQSKAQALTYLIIGGVLCGIGTAQDTIVATIFGDSTLMEASAVMGYHEKSEKQKELLELLQLYMHLVGLIAFVRGWIMIAKSHQSQQQGGGMGKGLTHIIGGALLMNIIGFLKVLANTVGIQNF